METLRKTNRARVMSGVLFKDVPADLYGHWKAICARRGVSMKKAFVDLIREEVRKELRARNRAGRAMAEDEEGAERESTGSADGIDLIEGTPPDLAVAGYGDDDVEAAEADDPEAVGRGNRPKKARRGPGFAANKPDRW